MRNMLKISMLRIMLPWLPSIYPLSTRLARRFCRAGALWFSLPSPFNGRAAFLPRGRAQARQPRTALFFLLPPPYPEIFQYDLKNLGVWLFYVG